MTFSHIHNIVRRIVRSGDTENIAAEIVARCWEQNREPTYTEIIHRCYDFLRRKKLEESYLEARAVAERLGAASGSERDESQSDESDYLHRLLERTALTPEERMVLFKRFWQGRTIREIAAETGTTTAIVLDRLGSAEEKLLLEHYSRHSSREA